MQTGPEKVHRLVTFLGLGRRDPASGEYLPYDSTTYAFGERRAETTCFVCRALAELLEPEEIVVLATEQAERAQGTALRQALGNRSPKFEPIPAGEDSDQLWEQFHKIKEQLRHSSGPIMLDITHGFRSAPFFAAAVASFVRAVDDAPPDLRICYAGNLGTVTPIWELTEFLPLIDWAAELRMFLRTGRSSGIAKPTIRLGNELSRHWVEKREGPQPNLERLGKALRDFGANLETVRSGDLLLGTSGSAAALDAALQEARGSAAAIPPLADVLDRIQTSMVEPLLGAADHLANEAGHRALAGLARLYRDMGRWAEAAAVLREGWVTRHATPAGAFGERNQARPSLDEAARRAAEERWGESERAAVQEIAAVRNDVEHAGFKQQPSSADTLQRRLHKLVSDFRNLPTAAERAQSAGYPPVFVNLSNHPSAEWCGAQREAALELAPEIRDWTFPEVPPEAGVAEIAGLADQIVKRIAGDLPGATHAMVQGEFTLVHALVRRLQRRGVRCLAATTRREVIEEFAGTKTARFKFFRFREFG